MMYPVDALYARQSLDKQDSISIENQIEFCKYETRGGDYETYIDKGFSGKNTNRPAFAQMMQDIKAGKVKRVIVYKLDRISRSILDFSNMMQVFQEYHVEFVSSTEKFDTSTPIGNAMLNISIVFAQLERETIQKRVADAYYAKSQKGYYMGGRVPFGFKLENTILHGIRTSRFVPEPEEMKQIKLIYKLYSKQDMTLGAVMRELQEHGFTKKRGASWCTARISEIVRNPVYVKADIDVYNFFESQGSHIVNPASDYIGTNGIFLYKGCNGDKTRRKQYELVDRDVVLAPHEGVIDSGIWLKCRLKIMNNRQSARTNKGKRTWLSGKVKCKKCGYAYTVTRSNTTAGRYFQCSGSRYSVKCKGASYTVYADVFEGHVLGEIKKELAKFQYLSEELAQEVSLADTQNKIRIAEIDKEITSLLPKVADANKTLMNYLNNRIEELDKEKQYLLEKLIGTTANKPEEKLDKITDYISKWTDLSLEDKQKIADILIKVIYIDEDVIEIEWNI
ncbi:recombinase family protein [Lachnospiraceae bacterium 29-84]